MRICVIEASPFRSTLDALDAGKLETYQGQTYSTTFIRNLAARAEKVTVISAMAPGHDDSDRKNLAFRHLDVFTAGGSQALHRAILEAAPTHTLVRMPLASAIRVARGCGSRVAAMLADTFSADGWSPKQIRKRLRYRQLAHALNLPEVDLVGNHNRAACRDLLKIGVEKSKTIPWEWPTPQTPADFSAKSIEAGQPIELLYVGAITPKKGVHDILEAIASNAPLRQRARVTFYGKGETEALKAQAEALGIADRVTVAGIVPNTEVSQRMREAQVVLVPSHHSYAEGMPKTIREALTVRTPVVISDHPSFQGYFSGAHGIQMVPQHRPDAIAHAIGEIVNSPEIYAVHSNATAQAFADIDCPTKWADVIDHWLNGDPEGYLKDRLGNWS